MARVSTFGLPGDALGANKKRGMPQARGAARRTNPVGAQRTTSTAPTAPRVPSVQGYLQGKTQGRGQYDFGQRLQEAFGFAEGQRGQGHPLGTDAGNIVGNYVHTGQVPEGFDISGFQNQLRSILGQFLQGNQSNFGAGINRGIAQRNLAYNIAGQERDLAAGSQISGINRDAALRNSLGGIGLQRTFAGENQSLLGATRRVEDRVGFRDHLSSVAGLAQGVQARARKDLLEARGLRDRGDALGASQTRRGLDHAAGQARDQFDTSGQIQDIREGLAREDISAYQANETANIADRYSAETHRSRFNVGSLPVFEF